MKNRMNKPSSARAIGKSRAFSFSDPSFLDEVNRLLDRAGLLSPCPIAIDEKLPEPELPRPRSRFN